MTDTNDKQAVRDYAALHDVSYQTALRMLSDDVPCLNHKCSGKAKRTDDGSTRQCTKCGLLGNPEALLAWRYQDRKASEQAVAQVRRARKLADAGGSDDEVFGLLARAFEGLKDAPGIVPWNRDTLLDWATHQARQEQYAAQFLVYAREVRALKELNLFELLKCWPAGYWAALHEWLDGRIYGHPDRWRAALSVAPAEDLPPDEFEWLRMLMRQWGSWFFSTAIESMTKPYLVASAIALISAKSKMPPELAAAEVNRLVSETGYESLVPLIRDEPEPSHLEDGADLLRDAGRAVTEWWEDHLLSVGRSSAT